MFQFSSKIKDFKNLKGKTLIIESFSVNKFYDLPNLKSLRSTSFGFGTKTDF